MPGTFLHTELQTRTTSSYVNRLALILGVTSTLIALVSGVVRVAVTTCANVHLKR